MCCLPVPSCGGCTANAVTRSSSRPYRPICTGAAAGSVTSGTNSSPERLPYLYAGLSPLTALCETLARDLRAGPDGRRRITRPRVRGMLLSKVVAATDLPLVDLTDNSRLAAVRQDIWLVQAEAPAYPRTRRWGSWIRGQADWAVGLRWPSRQDSGLLSGEVCALYERENGPALLKPSSEPPLELDTPAGRDDVNGLLEPLRIRVEHPRRRP